MIQSLGAIADVKECCPCGPHALDTRVLVPPLQVIRQQGGLRRRPKYSHGSSICVLHEGTGANAEANEGLDRGLVGGPPAYYWEAGE